MKRRNVSGFPLTELIYTLILRLSSEKSIIFVDFLEKALFCAYGGGKRRLNMFTHADAVEGAAPDHGGVDRGVAEFLVERDRLDPAVDRDFAESELAHTQRVPRSARLRSRTGR